MTCDTNPLSLGKDVVCTNSRGQGRWSGGQEDRRSGRQGSGRQEVRKTEVRKTGGQDACGTKQWLQGSGLRSRRWCHQFGPNQPPRKFPTFSPGVGKTSMVQRFISGTFRESYVPTIEDTYRKTISSKTPNSPPAVCTLQITDTTGSHQFPAMQRLSISKGRC